jgi:hypothetical protein
MNFTPNGIKAGISIETSRAHLLTYSLASPLHQTSESYAIESMVGGDGSTAVQVPILIRMRLTETAALHCGHPGSAANSLSRAWMAIDG